MKLFAKSILIVLIISFIGCTGYKNENESIQTMNNHRAKKIADYVNFYNEVDKTIVILNGNTAMIGVTTNNNMNNKQWLIKKIKNKVKTLDNGIKYVLVTTKKEIINEMNDVYANISEDQDKTDISKKLSKIIMRIQPII